MQQPANSCQPVRRWFAGWRHRRLCDVFIYYLFSVALTLISLGVFFSYVVCIIYDGLLTMSQYLFLIVSCILLLDKNTSTWHLFGSRTHKPLGLSTLGQVKSSYPVYAPTILWTSACSDELIGLIWFMDPRTPRTSTYSDELARLSWLFLSESMQKRVQ